MVKKEKRKKDNFVAEIVIAIASILFFIYLIIDVKNNLFFSNIDNQINQIFSQVNNPTIILVSKIITDIFNPIIFIILSLVVFSILFYKKRKKESLFFLIATSIAFIIGSIVKIIVHRARPENILVLEKTFSFPSTHALMAVIFFGMLIYLIELHIKSTSKKTLLTIVATIATLIMGLTRIILNAHYFSDVIAGFSLGISILCFYLIIIKKARILN